MILKTSFFYPGFRVMCRHSGPKLEHEKRVVLHKIFTPDHKRVTKQCEFYGKALWMPDSGVCGNLHRRMYA